MKMEDWKECTLSDLGTILGGATPSTKDSSNYENGSIAWITPKDLSTYTERFISHGERNITEKGLKSCSAQLMPPNSILFTSRAPIGYIAIAKNEVCTNQGFKSIIPNKDTDFMFLYYLLRYNKDNIENLGSGTTFKEVSGSTMRNVPVKVPPLPTQQKIADILSSLDDKIELNNKINTNLEQQAQALFKNWFVDFGPFGGKMPEGWKEVEFRDVCENLTDGVHNIVVDDPNGEYLLLSCKNIKGGVLTISSSERKINKETFEKLRKRTKLAKGDILLSSVGTVGEMYLLNETPDNYEFQRSVAIIKPNTSLISPAFLYESMLFQKDTIIHSAHGAVQQCIFISDVGDFTTILPTIDIIEKFTKIVQPMLDTITANQHENQKLANFRDTLLPKLMNGEIEVL